MDLSELKSQVKQYKAVLRKVKQYRKDWTAAKELIINTLHTIIKETDLDVEVETEEVVTGMELIYLSFGKRPSGIIERIDETNRPLIKEGGYLFYSQTYNGKVSVWFTEPMIEKFVEQQSPIQLETKEPAEITDFDIVRHVSAFVEAMVLWEDQDLEQSNEIGFKRNGES